MKSENKSSLKIKARNTLILKLKSVINVSSIIISTLDKKAVLNEILEKTKMIMECNDSSILLVDYEKNQLYFDALSNEKDIDALKDIRLNMGEGIAGYVWESEKSILIKDVSRDKRFSKKVDQKLKNTTKSIIAIPLVVNERVIGVMEAINKKNGTSFNKSNLEIFQLLGIFAAIAIENAILYEMAITDGLTKLFVKSFFLSRLAEEFNRAKRQNYNLSLIMFDIDFFKDFNDTYGHPLGDIVLKNTGNIFIQASRKSDIPTRFGGEEFAVLLPDTDKEGAYIYAERIREMIKESKIKRKNKNLAYTISAGIAELNLNKPANHADLLEMADKALYFSKRNGRNQVNVYNENMETD